MANKPEPEGTTRRVLVTGGSGFIGGAVVSRLVDTGHTVTATATKITRDLPEAAGLTWIPWDATESPLPGADWHETDVVCHLAAPRSLFDVPNDAEAIFEVTVEAGFRILEAARSAGIKRIVLASTGDVLGASDGPAPETAGPFAPDSFYGAAKAAAELLAGAYGKLVPNAVLRFYHPYGPGGGRFLVNRLIKAVMDEEVITIEHDHGIRLNPVWLSDLAEGVCLAIDSDQTGVFHLAGPETVTLRQLLELIGELAGRTPHIRHTPEPGVERHLGGDDRARALLGYKPRTMLRDGLKRLIG